MGQLISAGDATLPSDQAVNGNQIAADAAVLRSDNSPAASGITHYRGLPAYALVRHAAETIPERGAVVYGTRTWSYEQLNHDIVRCSAMLQSIGICKGDRVGVLLPNVPEFLIATNSIWRAGAVVVALSPLMVEREVSTMIRQTGCKLVITLDVLAHLTAGCDDEIEQTLYVSMRQDLPSYKQLGYLWIRAQRTGTWSLPGDDSHRWLWEEIHACRREWKGVEIDPIADPAYILPTGGTTGDPKSVTLTHQNMVANAWQQYQWTDRSFGKETMVAVLPFFHSYGVSAIAMAGAAMGATLLLHHRFSVRHVIQMIARQQPTVLHAVPAMLVALNERLRDYPADLSSIRWVISGGATLPGPVAAEFSERTGALVVEGYGLSEASPVTHVGHLFNDPQYGTIGMPLPETECRIVDQNDAELDLPIGEVGELIIRGPQVMKGYWNNQHATAMSIRNGWLHTGDLATVDAHGVYTIVGRKKDLIITSGFNVYPAEVEAVLRDAPGVADVAVVAIADSERGEIVKAFVVPTPGVTWDEAALREFCQTRLAKHKRPRQYERCTGELPKNFLGKVIRRKLREKSEDSQTVDTL